MLINRMVETRYNVYAYAKAFWIISIPLVGVKVCAATFKTHARVIYELAAALYGMVSLSNAEFGTPERPKENTWRVNLARHDDLHMLSKYCQRHCV